MAAANPNPHIDVIKQYMDNIKNKYPAYTFCEGTQINEYGYEFYVKTALGEENACHCLLYIDKGEYAPHNTRSEQKEEVYGIKVNSIYTYEGHTGQRLGIALLFYSICWLLLYSHIPADYKYIKLDDATNGKHPLALDNFYIRLGFVPRGRVALPSKGKQLESKGADEVKIADMQYFIDVMLEKKFGTLGGYRKKRTMRANQIRSKSKRNKRTIRARSKRSKRILKN
jgi:hypothetical protein